MNQTAVMFMYYIDGHQDKTVETYFKQYGPIYQELEKLVWENEMNMWNDLDDDEE